MYNSNCFFGNLLLLSMEYRQITITLQLHFHVLALKTVQIVNTNMNLRTGQTQVNSKTPPPPPSPVPPHQLLDPSPAAKCASPGGKRSGGGGAIGHAPAIVPAPGAIGPPARIDLNASLGEVDAGVGGCEPRRRARRNDHRLIPAAAWRQVNQPAPDRICR